MAFLLLLTIPLLLAIGGFILLKGITWKEFLVQVAVQVLIAGISAAILYFANIHDTELIISFVIGIVIALGLTYFFNREDIFNEE